MIFYLFVIIFGGFEISGLTFPCQARYKTHNTKPNLFRT